MKSFSFLIFILLIVGCVQNKSIPITEFSQSDMKDGILIDVRTPEEYGLGHLENAVNINVLADDFVKHFDDISKKKTIYVYCKKGGRSAKAAKSLEDLGYTVVDLLGGYDALHPNE